ncbi:MAG: glycosyltransferase family 4 protein [bacterium]|nr:glycosyltransferase family 4 protein [bacterium]
MENRATHIVLDALLVNEKPTGVGRSILELTQAMAQLNTHYEFTILTTSPESFAWLESNPQWNVKFCAGATGGTFRKAFFSQFKIPTLCRQLKADILHSLQFVAPLFVPCLSVVTVHDLAWQIFPETVEQPRRGYYQLLVPQSLKRANEIVTNSQATADDVKKYYPQCSKVTVTPFGTPSWAVAEPIAEQRNTEGRPFFLFVGTLEPRKNLERILKAYSRLLEKDPAPQLTQWPSLLLVGSKGWKDSHLRKMMQPLLQSGDLKIEDYCDTPRLKELYLSAQALLFPSLHEGFGFPILEAMALQLPVITSGKGAMAEVAGQYALLVDAENTDQLCSQMAILSQTPELRERLASDGPRRARQWTWEQTALKTFEVYDNISG